MYVHAGTRAHVRDSVPMPYMYAMRVLLFCVPFRACSPLGQIRDPCRVHTIRAREREREHVPCVMMCDHV